MSKNDEKCQKKRKNVVNMLFIEILCDTIYLEVGSSTKLFFCRTRSYSRA